MVKHIPDGYHTITPYLCVKGVSKLIEFLKQSFDVSECNVCHTDDDGAVMHAEVKIGDSLLMLGEAHADYKAAPTNLYLYVKDTDKVYNQALKAGGQSVQKPENKFYGDRNAGVKDPSGNTWWIATRVENVSPEELAKRIKEQGKHPVGASK